MVLCDKNCKPCCDFCIHVYHEIYTFGDKQIKGRPKGCHLHRDLEHMEIVEASYYCDDFHCFNVTAE